MTIKTHAVKKGRIPLKHEVNAFELAGDMFKRTTQKVIAAGELLEQTAGFLRIGRNY